MDRPPVTVEAAGVLSRAKRRQDFCRVWVDFDTGQWYAGEGDGMTPGIQLDRSGKLRFAAASGSTFANDAYTELWYHIHGGVSTEQDIYGLSFSWRSSGTMTWVAYEVPTPYSGAVFTQLGTAGGATQAAPLDVNYTCTDARYGLALRVKYAVGKTLTADEFVEFSNLRVYGQSGDPSIGDSLTDILVGTGLADSFSSESVG